MTSIMKRILSVAFAAVFALYAYGPVAAQSRATSTSTTDSRPRVVTQNGTATASTTQTQQLGGAEQTDLSEEAAIQAQINSVYENFFNSYRLGAGDIIGIYIDKHPEDSVVRVAVSPVGQVYFPLIGNVKVAGKTMPQLQQLFTASVSEFIRDPRVTVSLLEGSSAKIGVLGDVRSPGVVIMARPMRVLDAITAAGGITDLGSGSNVSLLRQYEDGRVQMLTVNVKKILQGKANAEENAFLRAGDTIIVHGNFYKKLGKFTSLVGVTGFISFLARGGR